MQEDGPLKRKIAKAKRPTQQMPKRQVQILTGEENVAGIHPGDLRHHGYTVFLTPTNIETLFGKKIAESKKRKAELKNKLSDAMKLAVLKDNVVTVNDFINETKQIIQTKKEELEAIPRSPIDMEVMPIAAARATPVAAAAKVRVKRKKAKSPPVAAAAAAAAPPRSAPPRAAPPRATPYIPLVDDRNIAGPGPSWGPKEAEAARAARAAAVARYTNFQTMRNNSSSKSNSSTPKNSSSKSSSSQQKQPTKKTKGAVLKNDDTDALAHIFKTKGNVSRRKADLTPALKKQLEEKAAEKEKKETEAKELKRVRLASIQRYAEERAAAPVDTELAQMFNKRAGL